MRVAGRCRVRGRSASPAAIADRSAPTRSRLIRLLATLLLSACAAARAPLIATDLDADRQLALRVGQSLVITLPADPASGRIWLLAQQTLQALVLEGEPSFTQEPDSAAAGGAPGSEIWRFTAVRGGVDELQFEYRRPLEAGTPAARVIRYRVSAN